VWVGLKSNKRKPNGPISLCGQERFQGTFAKIETLKKGKGGKDVKEGGRICLAWIQPLKPDLKRKRERVGPIVRGGKKKRVPVVVGLRVRRREKGLTDPRMGKGEGSGWGRLRQKGGPKGYQTHKGQKLLPDHGRTLYKEETKAGHLAFMEGKGGGRGTSVTYNDRDQAVRGT